MPCRPNQSVAMAAIAYFAVVFAAGFALGILRLQVLQPRTGEAAAVLVELPIILAIAWFSCRWIVARLGVPEAAGARWAMGALALALLLTAEILLGTLAFGRTLAAHFERYGRLPELLGLFGQMAFAAFPYRLVSKRPGER